ncbi:MAG: hypothetical protein F4139_03595, partial [Gemmatimonadetes bacterium]|nr:hypothetical protein [Gemmatimonadota bacterium]
MGRRRRPRHALSHAARGGARVPARRAGRRDAGRPAAELRGHGRRRADQGRESAAGGICGHPGTEPGGFTEFSGDGDIAILSGFRRVSVTWSGSHGPAGWPSVRSGRDTLRRRTGIAFACLLAAPLIPSVPATAQAPTLQAAPVDPLVGAAWLLEHIDDDGVVVLHMERRPGRFEAEHIAGARPLRFDEIAWEGDEGWIAEFREMDEIVVALRRAGVNRDSRVVIYGGSMTATARTWVTFDLLGLGGRAFVLDGGMTAWKAAGGRVESGPAAVVEPGDVVPVDPADFRVSADWIHARLGDESLVLLDARPDDEYTGEDGGLGD